MSKKMGRPAIPQEEARKPGVSVRLSDAELAKIEKAIAQSGKSKSKWIRDALLSSAAKQG